MDFRTPHRLPLLFLTTAILLAVATGCASTRINPEDSSFGTIKNDPVMLRIFLADMPKGADLHNHLSGMIYAEDYIRLAAAKGMCFDPEKEYAVTAGPCKEPSVPAQKALTDAGLWNSVINAYSTRQDRRDSFMWGHDEFFATFGRFGGVSGNKGAMLAEAARMAEKDNVMYVELMLSVYPGDIKSMAGTAAAALGKGNLQDAYGQLESAGLFDEAHLREAMGRLSAWEKTRDNILKGGTGSDVAFHYINQVVRVLPPEFVFAQIAFSFALASKDPRVVALNLVAPEDNPVSMSDYELHMEMIDFLYRLYRNDPLKRKTADNVHIALHAGELTLGLVEPEGLSNHIRLAVEKGHAQRIGHGVDLPYEERPYELMQTMRDRGIAVEILLTSNDTILRVSGDRHPLNLYRQRGVPFVLATDDMGVARADMTNEFLRAVLEQGLGYEDLKEAVRNSLEYSFLPGKSLWADYARKTPSPGCDIGDSARSGNACAPMLESNRKAAMQWELERRLDAFEKRWSSRAPVIE
ncbi:MAG: adenosine deaminase [Deltaproteobacteria bacterium]|nr:adenosine deaminase [Deltaproteobacteria bacterium]